MDVLDYTKGAELYRILQIQSPYGSSSGEWGDLPQSLRDAYATTAKYMYEHTNGSECALVVKSPRLRNLLAECLKVLDTKGDDYTGGNKEQDRLWNFRTAADALKLPMRQIWFVYFFKHYTSILKYIRDGKVESEPIQGRIIDLINYLYLLTEIIAEENEPNEP